jgi:hypothetical protein
MTPPEYDALSFAAHWENVIGPGGLLTNRVIRKRDAERCVRRGWLVSQQLRVCDGDGCALEPERYRLGYVLTDAGRRAFADEERRMAGRKLTLV